MRRNYARGNGNENTQAVKNTDTRETHARGMSRSCERGKNIYLFLRETISGTKYSRGLDRNRPVEAGISRSGGQLASGGPRPRSQTGPAGRRLRGLIDGRKYSQRIREASGPARLAFL